MNNYVDKVILIVGPTGVGKTELAIRLAERINGEIISADSRYLYRGMNVGTAKPNSNDRNRVPHHLIDVANPDETWSLANFIDRTLLLIEEIHKRQRSVVIVGGSGQYFRALIEGWQIPELEANHLLRDCLGDWAEDISGIGLHHKLAIIDPQAAEKIDPTNIRRTIRGLEVIFSTGRRFSELRKRVEPMYRYHVIGLTMPREKLYARIDQRVEEMIDYGLVKEVQTLLDHGYSATLPSMSAIGYHEIFRFLMGEITIDQAKELMRRRTRNLVRRQANWFKPSDTDINWYDAEPYPIEKIIADLEENMSR